MKHLDLDYFVRFTSCFYEYLQTNTRKSALNNFRPLFFNKNLAKRDFEGEN